jgi:4-hydroxy-3-polyprenylbenzoate decarboxylase
MLKARGRSIYVAEYRGLPELVELLEKQGKLYRYHDRINKDTELIPLYRVQMRGVPESERRALLFENVVGNRGESYDLAVLAGVYGASDEILAIGMGCTGYVEMLVRWHQALENPLAPVRVEAGPAQEVVLTGTEIKERGLDILPVPVEDPGFSGMIRTGLPMVTKDPETGIYNIGTYNGFFRSRDRIAAGIAPNKHAVYYHLRSAQRRGEQLPIAILIGCSPAVMLVGSARIPYGVDDLAVAGGITGEPVPLVTCKTIPLEVPADTEIVIEGLVSIDTEEPRGAFGEYPGHLNVDRTPCPVLHVTAITHRRNAMFTPVPVGFPPSDCNAVFGFCYAAQVYHRLKYECGLPVEEVYFPQEGGGSNFCAIRVSDGASQEAVWEMLQEAAANSDAKYVMAVDFDVNLRDSQLLIWALSFRSQPDEDVRVIPAGKRRFDPSADHRSGRLDPSAAPIGAGGRKEFFLTLINATRKYPYPPVALPRKEYMERAIQLWNAQEVLPTHLQDPWHGYLLGYWNADLQEDADFIVQGQYAKAGEKSAKRQRKVSVPSPLVGEGKREYPSPAREGI